MGAAGVCLASDFAGALRAFDFAGFDLDDFDEFALTRFFFDVVFLAALRALDFFEAFLFEAFFVAITLLPSPLQLQGYSMRGATAFMGWSTV